MECRICISLNVSKTKELIVDFRKRQQRPYTPLMISGTPVERVSSFKYLGVNISEDLTWTAHIQTKVKKAVQRLYQLRKFRVSPAILKTFYSRAIESVPTQCTDTEMQISLLIIFCIIEYVTNKTLTPWILDVVNIDFIRFYIFYLEFDLLLPYILLTFNLNRHNNYKISNSLFKTLHV